MVVDAERSRTRRPLAGVEGQVCFKKDLTGPTLLEISGYPTYQDLPAWSDDKFLVADYFGSYLELYSSRSAFSGSM